MIKAVNLIFPHQLFKDHKILKNGSPVYIIEEQLFFKQYNFHKRKLAFHRASMKFYAHYLKARGVDVQYIEAADERSDVRTLLSKLADEGVEKIWCIDPVDDWLRQRIEQVCEVNGLQNEVYDTPMFVNTIDDLHSFFDGEKEHYHQTNFYISQRKKHDILVDDDQKPIGGQWSFDPDNRKKYPKDKKPPPVYLPDKTEHHKEAEEYVENNFSDNPGELHNGFHFPISFGETEKWFRQFLEFRFKEFGPYQDAIVSNESFLHHSITTPMLNVGLITPQEILEMTLSFAEEHDIPLNSLEGYVRQVVGWREFMHGCYRYAGRYERTRNFWDFERDMPQAFYTAETGIPPVDNTIQQVLKAGWCHHIERLMILGNFMLLCEIKPDAVYQWFMELFIDAYDWVMVTNVYGMSQFADGGLISTKPYISSSNYILKMSDYPKGDWGETWDALFWRFMHVHRDYFQQNNRMKMLLGTFDNFDERKKRHLLGIADNYLKDL